MHYFYYDLAGFPTMVKWRRARRISRPVPGEVQRAARRLRDHRLHRLHGDVPGVRAGSPTIRQKVSAP